LDESHLYFIARKAEIMRKGKYETESQSKKDSKALTRPETAQLMHYKIKGARFQPRPFKNGIHSFAL